MAILRRTLWATGWSAVAVLVVVFLVGYTAPYLSPARFWWTNLFAVFLPALSLGVGLAGIGIAVWGATRHRWIHVVAASSLLLLVTLRFGPRLTAWVPVGQTADEVRLMTFNVPPSFHQDGSTDADLRTLIRREAPDVLAIQESHVRATAASPTKRVQSSPPIRPLLSDSIGYVLPRGLPQDVEVQQPVLGRIPLDSLSVHPLPPGGDVNPRFRYTRTRFTWKGRPVVLYNVHLHTVGKSRPWTMIGEMSLPRWRTFLRTYREGALRRAQQARFIRRQIERESVPVLVVGDFNSTPHQWAYRHLAKGLQSASRQRVRGWAVTFPAQRPLVQIDHVLASPAWKVTEAHVPPFQGSPPVSDHRPLAVRLRWRD